MTRLRALARDARGVALVEFALVVPVLVMLYVGTYQLCDAIGAYRKVVTTARALADLTSQYQTVSDSDLTMILSASSQVMAPYAASNAQIVLSQVSIDSAGNSKIAWSRGQNAMPYVVGQPYALPTAIKIPGSSYIVSEVAYPYTGSSVWVGSFTFTDRIFMSPRNVSQISKV